MANELGELIRNGRQAKGWTKAALARELVVSPAAISQWEAGKTMPTADNLLAVMRILDLKGPAFDNQLFEAGRQLALQTVEHIRSEQTEASNVRAADARSFGEIDILARDVPVYGSAVAGEDADFSLNGTETDRVARPVGLANAKGIFALYTVNDSMYPAWRENSLFFVNPHRRPSIGDDVVVELISDDPGVPGKAYLKRLKARTPTKIVVEQFNPPKDIEFERGAVRLYRVIPWEEALGLS